MNIIALYLDRPGYCMEPVARFLRQQGHKVHWAPLPIGGLGARFQQLVTPSLENSSSWDIAITPEPLCALGMRLRRIAKRQIFWRIDYRPRRHLYSSALLNYLAKGVDEVWSIVPDRNYRHVPFMLDPEDLVDLDAPGYARTREDRVLWIGPDYSGAGHAAIAAIRGLKNVLVATTNWQGKIASYSDVALRRLLFGSKVGLALYGDEKRYSDPSRVKKFLAAGLAVVTDDSYPFAQEIQDAGAGVCLKAPVEPVSVLKAVSYCLREDVWTDMSKRAVELAKDYVVSEKWIQL